MTSKTPRTNPFAFTPIILDQDSHEKRRVINQLPGVHRTETLQKFFGSSVDHLFDPGKGKAINGYVGQKPLWYDPDQDYYLEENTADRNFYQLEASMVSKNIEGELTDLLPYADLINQLRFQGALTNNHNRLFSQDFYTWCPPVDLDKLVNFRHYVWLPIDDVEATSTFEDGNANGWVLADGTPAPVDGPYAGFNKFLGRFAGTPNGDQVVSKSFTLNSVLNTTSIQFDFLKIDSWDAAATNGGGINERIVVYVNDQVAFEFVPVGISSEGGLSLGSGTIELGDITGTYDVTSPGVDSPLGGSDTWTDRVYRITINLNGTGKTLKLGFGSTTNQEIDDESLGIDNVRVWQSSKTGVVINGPTVSTISEGKTREFWLPGYGPAGDAEIRPFYDLNVLNRELIHASVDGEPRAFTYVPGARKITFEQRPADDAVVSVSVYSDLENNAIGLSSVNPKAFGGVALSSGMRIIISLDKNSDYKNSDVYIVEGVGTEIFLIKEEETFAGATPDYMVMARGAANGNEWSTRNRWFHVETLQSNMDPNYVLNHRATRPIIEFNRDLELYNYGLKRRLDVDLVIEDIEDLNGYMNQNPTDVTLNGVRFVATATGLINVAAVNPRTGITYGDVSGMRVMVRNTVNTLLNNNVLVLVNQGGVLKLILETDGENPSGAPVFGEVFKVMLGTYAGKNLHWDGNAWIVGQHKTKANQAPLFELYDLDGNRLRDEGLYPNPTFKGSKVFSYKQDLTGTRVADPVLGVSLVHDNKGQILFENYLSTDVYQYVVGGKFFDIQGFYFHKIGNIDPAKEALSNDWFKAPHQTRQFMVDRYVSDGRTKLFNVSQDADEIIVSRGRVNDSKSFERTQLVEDREFIRVGRQVMIINIQVGDIIEIRTYSKSNPPLDATGHYEVPLNLQANPDNAEVVDMTKGDFYDHFSEIMKKQVGFKGAEYASNNYRDTAKVRNLGTHIIQHSAGLLKTMLLASQSQLDMMTAIRYSETEYARFKDKFQQKILAYSNSGRLASADYGVWINTALEELNKGKTKNFPYYLSGMAQSDAYRLPTFIPATPSFIGVYPLYVPEMISQDVEGAEAVWFVRGHDGSLTQAQNETCANVMLLLEQRIFESIPAAIRLRERPVCDTHTAYGDQYRVNDYSYDEYLQILRPSFERWSVAYRQDYRINDTFNSNDPWTWNWSSQNVPGHWRGIYEKFFGTQRPDLTPWESLGFTIKPTWWDGRYGPAPYTSENLVLWDDLERGYIHAGERQGIDAKWARPGLSTYMPVDMRGRLRHPGPRNVIAHFDTTLDLGFVAGDPLVWEDTQDSGVLGCGICALVPLPQERSADWNFGDMGPVEQTWRRSSNFAFAVAGSGYLMKPAQFVEMGWNTQDLDLFFKGTSDEQWLNRDTKGRSNHRELQVHGEVLEDLSLVTKVGVQQWISDLLASKNTAINENFADRVRGLGAQLSYKVAGFTDSTTLVVVSDAFGRVPSEDVTISLYRSPSVREETYSGVAIEYTEQGYEVYGYDSLNPHFPMLPAAQNGSKISVGDGAKSATVPGWKANAYYGVGITIKHKDAFYRALKTHTSSAFFEPEFWTQVARPQYADGAALTWFLEGELEPEVQKLAYGTILKSPQEVANFLNGYQRYLESRGWIFDEVDSGDMEVRDWKFALKSFITWSKSDARQIGDYITLSPLSQLIRFKTEQGTIQPVEQIINGLYAIVDQTGQPIDSQLTRVVRNDGDISVSCNAGQTGIFGLRLYVSELEHVLVFNNKTIFGDTIYSPLLNIKQPRLRLQGFKTVGWKGRIDAPGFIVTGDTLTPNFERAADDFRRFFDIESMENKKLQDRARANFGYEEKEYLNNLLLTPTNQFEFYQGMIQQKGSTTSMRRLLRSNFVRHNKGLKLFEEWAFRVGDYGGQDVTPQLDIQILQSEFKHNPQLIQFSNAASQNNFGIIDVVDVNVGQETRVLDARWYWRPDMKKIEWPLVDLTQKNSVLPTAGFVNLNEVRFTVPDHAAFEEFFGNQNDTDEPVEEGDRVWVYGIGEGDTEKAWKTYQYKRTGLKMLGSSVPTHPTQGTVVHINDVVKGFVDLGTDPLNRVFHVSQPLLNGAYDADGIAISGERLLLGSVEGSDINPRGTYRPKFMGFAKTTLEPATSTDGFIMGFVPEAQQIIKSIKVIVDEPFADGSTLEIGHGGDFDLFVAARQEQSREINPGAFNDERVLVQTPGTTYIAPKNSDGTDVTVADIKLMRVGRVQSFCDITTVEWTWVRDDGHAVSGTVDFMSPSEATDSQNYEDAFTQVIQVPITSNSTTGTVTVAANGQVDVQNITFVPSSQATKNSVDLTYAGIYEFNHTTAGSLFPWNTAQAGAYRDMLATLVSTSAEGSLRIEVEYFYARGFELTEEVNGSIVPVVTNEDGGAGDIFTWVVTRHPTLENLPNLLNVGDLIEVDSSREFPGLWAVYEKTASDWKIVRLQNRKVNSDLLTSAAIFNSQENKLKQILQLYDPAKGFIPGIVDRELDFKDMTDPAVYNDGHLVWGKDQVGQLWWDLSAVRYLDYEIYDRAIRVTDEVGNVSWVGDGVNYRWKNWGRVAPNSNVDIYQWTRSPVAPNGWSDYVESKATLKIDNKPSGTVLETARFVTTNEWNDEIQTDETIYYFWVKNPTVIPTLPNRKLSAQQISNVLLNPTGNDIPFFAVVDTNKVIVGGIKQFLNETDTILKVKWLKDAEITNNHHKQWMLVREEDERNTINDALWNKMRDSLVGWDATQLSVPDAKLPRAQQIGAAIRPRQSWYPAVTSPNGGQRASRDARAAFVDSLNDILSEQPFMDQWYNWAEVFDQGEPLPKSDQYVTTALDLVDLKNLLPASRGMVQPGECVLIQNTTEVSGFWTLWKLVSDSNGIRSFVLSDFQKWRMQEGELWNLADWYAEGWSAKNFPNYRFPTYAARDAAGNLDVTLLKGTLVQIDEQEPGDSRWSWDVYTSTTKYQVAKARSTMRLSSAFYDNDRVEFGSKQITEILASNISPERIQELADVVNYRDGSSEIEFMLNRMKTLLLDSLQKNRLFFSMVKSAFKQTQVIDWAFKTSFLYLGGYSETLRQSPVAFKDQIDNVISYLEDVKPYHVKIREYVRRLSYGPDVADLAITDFDKPVYPDGQRNRVLDINNPADQTIMSANRPWKDWYDNRLKTNTDLSKWDTDWNGVRKMNVKIKFDRISCGSIRGWDTSPWDPTLLVYSRQGNDIQNLSQLSTLYRNVDTQGIANYFRDQTVETVEERNMLVRKNIVTPDRPGTIVTVILTGDHYMWSGDDWIKFEAIGWDKDPDMGSATRIDESYRPQPGMKRKDDPGLIAGCDFDGVVMTDSFIDDTWDVFEWSTTPYDHAVRDFVGRDQDGVDGNSSDPLDHGNTQNEVIPEGNAVVDYTMRSAGLSANNHFSGIKRGNDIVGGSQVPRSYGVFVFNNDSVATSYETFDIHGLFSDGREPIWAEEAARMAAHLNSIPDGTTVVVISFDEPSMHHLESGLGAAMARIGAGGLFLTDGFMKYRSAYILLGKAGVGQNGGREFYKGSVGDSPYNFIDLNVRMVDGVPYVLSSSPEGSSDESDIKITGNEFSQPAVNGNRPHELVQIRGVESLIVNVQASSGIKRKMFMDTKGKWQDVDVVSETMTFVDWDQRARKVSLAVNNWAEDAQGYTPLHDPHNPSTGFIRDVMISKGYRSSSNVNMTTAGQKIFKLRDTFDVDVIPAGLRGNNVRVAVVNPKNPGKRALGTLTNSRGSESGWDGSLVVMFDEEGFQDIGQGKSWNIIPVSMFNEPGIVWIGDARFTYSWIEVGSNAVTLNEVYLTSATLAPLSLGGETVELVKTSPIVDGSKQRQKA